MGLTAHGLKSRLAAPAPAPKYWNKGGHGQFGGGAHGERVEREPITVVWGRVQGQSPWSGGQGGEAPLKLKAF